MFLAKAGMSIDDAAQVVVESWDRYWADREKETVYDDSGRFVISEPSKQSNFTRDLRDAAWCVFHSDGNAGVEKLFYKCIKGKKRPELTFMAGAMDKGLGGIGSWMA